MTVNSVLLSTNVLLKLILCVLVTGWVFEGSLGGGYGVAFFVWSGFFLIARSLDKRITSCFLSSQLQNNVEQKVSGIQESQPELQATTLAASPSVQFQ